MPTRLRAARPAAMRCAKLLCATLLCASAWQPAQAGRPLATDDAGTAPGGECQDESWFARSQDERAWILSPACGVAEGLELGAELSLPRPRDTVRAGAGLAVKWVPASWAWDTPAGAVARGLKAGAALERPAAASWEHTGHVLLGLATLAPADSVAVHANLGSTHDRAAQADATVLNLAATSTPTADWMVFGEVLTTDRRRLLGPTSRTGGVRWWVTLGRVGVDLTLGRTNGTTDSLVLTLGLGWYGLLR